MVNDILLIGGVVLLVAAFLLAQRQRERAMLRAMDRAGEDPEAIIAVLDEAVAENKETEEFWRHQNPR